MKANWLERVVCYYNASYAHKREVYDSSKKCSTLSISDQKYTKTHACFHFFIDVLF